MCDTEQVKELEVTEMVEYFRERVKEVFDGYKNPDGREAPLYISVLGDASRTVDKLVSCIGKLKYDKNYLTNELNVARTTLNPRDIESYDGRDFCGVPCAFMENLFIEKLKASLQSFADELKTYEREWDNPYGNIDKVIADPVEVIDEVYTKIINEINMQPVTHPWISVTEKMPEYGENVYVCVQYKFGQQYISTNSYDTHFKDWITDIPKDFKITHWRPITMKLPEAVTKEEWDKI